MIGVIRLWPTPTIPAGFLNCNGDYVSQIAYPDLYLLIGGVYGPDVLATFKLPDLRGYIPRCYAGAVTSDPGAASRTDRGDATTGNAVGTKQPEATLQHSHNLLGSQSLGSTVGFVQQVNSVAGAADGVTSPTGSNSRPVNIYLIPIIEALP